MRAGSGSASRSDRAIRCSRRRATDELEPRVLRAGRPHRAAVLVDPLVALLERSEAPPTGLLESLHVLANELFCFLERVPRDPLRILRAAGRLTFIEAGEVDDADERSERLVAVFFGLDREPSSQPVRCLR